MNPLAIRAIVFILMLLGAAAGGAYFGHGVGVNSQKVADQVEFDRINAERTVQKAEANKLYRTALEDIVKLEAARDKFKRDLEVKHEADRKATAAAADKYAGLELRFRATQSAGDRANSGGAKASESNAPGIALTPAVELPKQITADLRQLTREADELADDYRLCHAYVNAPVD